MGKRITRVKVRSQIEDYYIHHSLVEGGSSNDGEEDGLEFCFIAANDRTLDWVGGKKEEGIKHDTQLLVIRHG